MALALLWTGRLSRMTTSTGRQRRGELGLDPQVEGGAVHRLVDDLWGGEPIAAQAGDECLGVPVTERRGAGQPGPTPRAATQPHHLGGHGGLVDEHEAGRLVAHPALARADQLRRASATSARPRSAAIRAFFICEPVPHRSATGRPDRRRARPRSRTRRYRRLWECASSLPKPEAPDARADRIRDAQGPRSSLVPDCPWIRPLRRTGPTGGGQLQRP